LIEEQMVDDGIAYLPWRNANFVFKNIKEFFDSDTYSESILKGLITSSGGLTESTLKASQNSLFEYLSDATKVLGSDGKPDRAAGIEKKRVLIMRLNKIFGKCQKEDRVTVPMMKTIEMLLTADYISDSELESEILEVHRLAVAECNKTKNISKLISAVGLFAGLLSLPSVEAQRRAVKSLLFLLFHNFPKVRQIAAEKLYTGLLTLEEYD
jgi:tubulin-specific chaperone D